MSSPPSAGLSTAAAGSPPSRAPRKKRYRVLLVDDEESILRALRRLLRGQPYEVVTTGGAEEALRLLEKEPAHLVMSDHRMPGQTGVEFLREVRRRWPDTIRIILSGYTEVKAIIDAINDGEVYKYLTKPWNEEEIKLHLVRALEQYELQAENERLTREIVAQNDKLRELNALLDQRASDATHGFASYQNVLEAAGVTMLTLDDHGMIVWANAQAMELSPPDGPGLIGTPAHAALPDAFHEAIDGGRAQGDGLFCGRLTFDGHAYQWRRRPVSASGAPRGSVVAIWREVD